jgi:hypothetical protein
MRTNSEELMATIKASQERMEALMDVSLETTEACLEQTEANQGKVEIKMEACLEEMKVEITGALGDPCLAVRCRGSPMKWTQGNGGSRQKLAAVRGWLTCHAVSGLCKGHGRHRPGRDNVARGAPKGRMLEKR